MSNGSSAAILRGGCPAPFFSPALFPDTGGFIDGRLCQSYGTIHCCLPCPLVDWVYPDYFGGLSAAANWVSVVSTIASAFLLLSWACLPVECTNRHYLSISLTSAVIMMNLGFIIPFVARPKQCYNEITPNSMGSSSICAASGSFLLFGGFAGLMWVFLRSFSLHLQICWQVSVGRTFMVVSQLLGWGVPLFMLALALVFSGVSFRFGDTCHINHSNSLADFWVPLLVVAALTLVVTFSTFGYCIKVYLQSLVDAPASITTSSHNLPTTSYQPSIPATISAAQAYRRIRRVISLQWRGIAIVLIIISDVIFFSVVFVSQDNTLNAVQHDISLTDVWVICLIVNQGNKNACLEYARALVVSDTTVVAVLLLLALNGIWLLLFLGRTSMLIGWYKLVTGIFRRNKREFVSVDAMYEYPKSRRSHDLLSRHSSVASPFAANSKYYYQNYAAVARQPLTLAHSFSNPRPFSISLPRQSTDPEPSASSAPRSNPQTSGSGPWETCSPPRSPCSYLSRPRGCEDLDPLGMNRI